MKKKLKLNTFGYFTHYWPAILFAGLTMWSLYLMLTTTDSATLQRTLYIFYFCGPIGVLIFFIQKRRLQYTIIKIALTPLEIEKVICYLEDNKGWKRKHKSDSIYVATTQSRWLSGSWGEQITIEQDHNIIYINSICDPNKNPSLTSWGRNKRNIKTFKERLALYEKAEVLKSF